MSCSHDHPLAAHFSLAASDEGPSRVLLTSGAEIVGVVTNWMARENQVHIAIPKTGGPGYCHDLVIVADHIIAIRWEDKP